MLLLFTEGFFFLFLSSTAPHGPASGAERRAEDEGCLFPLIFSNHHRFHRGAPLKLLELFELFELFELLER